jgi:hypothetical protein
MPAEESLFSQRNLSSVNLQNGLSSEATSHDQIHLLMEIASLVDEQQKKEEDQMIQSLKEKVSKTDLSQLKCGNDFARAFGLTSEEGYHVSFMKVIFEGFEWNKKDNPLEKEQVDLLLKKEWEHPQDYSYNYFHPRQDFLPPHVAAIVRAVWEKRYLAFFENE